MNGSKPLPKSFITPDEALRLFKYAKTEEMERCVELYNTYAETRLIKSKVSWDLMSLLSFVYDTGRVQGIREERAKRYK